MVNLDVSDSEPGLLYNIRILWYCLWMCTRVLASFLYGATVFDFDGQYAADDGALKISRPT